MQHKVKNLKHARGKLRKVAHASKEKPSLKGSFKSKYTAKIKTVNFTKYALKSTSVSGSFGGKKIRENMEGQRIISNQF